MAFREVAVPEVLRKYGAEGWELVTLNRDADLRGKRDGHLLVFKRPVESS